MPGILGIIGLVLRGAAAVGLVAFCGWSSFVLGTGHAALLALVTQGGQIALALLGVVGGLGCIVSLPRDTEGRSGPWQDGFDADATITRATAQRPASPSAGGHQSFYQPTRPTFGQR